MKTRFFHSVLILMFCCLSTSLFAQNEVEESAKNAIKNGNAKALSTNFNETVEISFDGQKQSYSKTQAEFVVRDFFKKYPVTDFEYLHQGSSKEGLKYIIGKYKHAGGSFRVYMLIKQFKGKYLIDTLDFSAE
jgi:hypothetical protein